MPQPLTFAVPKGRILDEALPVMARAGLVPESAFHDKGNRALYFACEGGDMRIIRVRAFDDANHYVLEDKHEILVPEIRRFLDANPLR